MKIIKNVRQKKVWDHWKKIEGFSSDDFRSDIRNPLPSDTKWYLALIEQTDIKNMHIISSDDWKDVSSGTFLVERVAKNLNSSSFNRDTVRISNDIKVKIDFLRSGKLFDTKLIVVSDGVRGFFTIIEGNRRSVALLSVGQLTGRGIYLGISSSMKSYIWARHTYE